jgi:hypothetical protein
MRAPVYGSRGPRVLVCDPRLIPESKEMTIARLARLLDEAMRAAEYWRQRAARAEGDGHADTRRG